MASPASTSYLLKIETLEDRTLLASDFPWVDAAIQGDADYQVDIVLYPDNYRVIVIGDDAGSVTINVDFFPEDFISLAVSSFSDVSIVGESNLDFLYAVDIINLSVGIDLTKVLSTEEVGRLTLEAESPTLILQGAYTLVEAEDFTNVFIYSNLNTLELSTSNPNSGLSIVGLTAGQTVRANFEPESLYLSGFENPGILFTAVFENPIELLPEETDDRQRLDFINPDFLVAERFLSLEETLRNFSLSRQNAGEARLEPNEIPSTGLFSDTQTFDNQTLIDNVQSLTPYIFNGVFSEESVDTFVGYNPALSDRLDSAEGGEFMVYLSDLIGTEGELTPNNEEPVNPNVAQDLNLVQIPIRATPPDNEEGQSDAQDQDGVVNTWLQRMNESFEKIYRKTQNLAATLKIYLVQQITNEFTPGERPGLIVDAQTPRNNYKHIKPV